MYFREREIYLLIWEREREGERGYYSSQPATVNKCFSVNNEDLVLPNEEAYMVILMKTASLNISIPPISITAILG